MKMKKITIILLFISMMYSYSFSQSKVTAIQIGDRVDFSIDGNFSQAIFSPDNEKYPFFIRLMDHQTLL